MQHVGNRYYWTCIHTYVHMNSLSLREARPGQLVVTEIRTVSPVMWLEREWITRVEVVMEVIIKLPTAAGNAVSIYLAVA